MKMLTFWNMLLLFAAYSGQSNPEDEMTKQIIKKEIKLFYSNNCPYCHKVINFLKAHNWLDKITLTNIQDTNHKNELLKINGHLQVPFIFDEINNVQMLESLDIIHYLKNLFTENK